MNAIDTAPNGATAEVSGGTRIQSVSRASQILLWVAQQAHGATAKDIAAAQGLTLPTTYHLVNTLVDQGLLTKDAARHYVLGGATAVLAQAYLRGKSVSESLLAALRELAGRTHETAYMADWGEHDIRVLASVEGSQLVRVAEVASGPYDHGHARANGKVLLAYAWPEIREAYLRTHGLVRVTDATIVDPDELQRELRASASAATRSTRRSTRSASPASRRRCCTRAASSRRSACRCRRNASRSARPS